MPTIDLSKEVSQSSSPSPRHNRRLACLTNRRQSLERQFEFIAAKTKQILIIPYNPEYWFRRADALLALGYPELAAGDARKACLLVECALDNIESEIGKRVTSAFGTFLRLEEYDEGKERKEPHQWTSRVQECMTELLRNTYRVLIKAVEFTLDPWEALHICQQAKIRCPEDSFFPHEFRVYKKQFEEGRRSILSQGHGAAEANRYLIQGIIYLRQYPFVSLAHLRRSQTLITSVQSELDIVSSKCKLARSPDLEDSDGISSASAVLGIFASSDIAAEERLFVDTTMIGGTNTLLTPKELICESCSGTIPPESKKKVSAACCSTLYCSKQCQTKASASYHRVLCRKDFSWLFEAAKTANHCNLPGLDGLVWLRVLSMCVQSDCHPLEHPLLARLTPQYSSDTVNRWSYEWNVDVPIRILQLLGIDVWADHRFDTWVLQTVWARLMNNRNVRMHHGRPVCGVHPLFSFFNHSCEPNAAWKSSMETSTGGTTLEITAIKPIRQNEEIVISYCDDGGNGDDPSKHQRQEMLMPWLAQNCSCPRCLREP